MNIHERHVVKLLDAATRRGAVDGLSLKLIIPLLRNATFCFQSRIWYDAP